MKNIYLLMLLTILFWSCQTDRDQTDQVFTPQNIKEQVFEVDITKDTLLIAQGGTQLLIQKNTFQQADEKGIVKLKVKEVLSKKDMVLSALFTVSSDGQTLESGGMVYLETAPKQTDGFAKSIQVRVPAIGGVKKDMELFALDLTGRWTPKGDLDSTAVEEQLAQGKLLYQRNCAACHSMDLTTMLTGPALGNVHLYRSLEWFTEFTKNSQRMIAEGEDSLALCVWEAYNPVVMSSFESLTDAEVASIYLYLTNESMVKTLGRNDVSYILSCTTDTLPPLEGVEEQVIRTRRTVVTNLGTRSYNTRSHASADNLDTTNSISTPIIINPYGSLYQQFSARDIAWYNIDRFMSAVKGTIAVAPFNVSVKRGQEQGMLVLLMSEKYNIVVSLWPGIIGGNYSLPDKIPVRLPEGNIYILAIGSDDAENYSFAYKKLEVSENIADIILKTEPSSLEEIMDFIDTIE